MSRHQPSPPAPGPAHPAGPGAPAVVLINPNTSAATTRMMTAIARRTLAASGLRVRGVTVAAGPAMLTDPAALREAAPHVLAAAREALASGDCAALIVAAFGDPGVSELRAWLGEADGGTPESPPGPGPGPRGTADGPGPVPLPAPVTLPVPLPVVGIGEAALAEAAEGGRRFGIATTTPRLAAAIDAHVARMGLAAPYTGTRFTSGAPEHLAARPDALLAALTAAARACVVRGGAEAVVIGGGPLGDAADALRTRLAVPVVAPVPAACRQVARLLGVPLEDPSDDTPGTAPTP
ncbi:aspartate/glutamate racemase family protein [Streptomyces sp. NPDC004267]|uniref:aspartate/glutamate racemase family protein n=1 Tax=Streptomyces sp. NPDC004267 TaxID=3364694 RepID=UPI0036A54CB2